MDDGHRPSSIVHLDTCVISELVARQPHPRVVAWVDAVEEAQLYLSVITIGEIRRGIAKLPASPRKERLNRWLEENLLLRFTGRIVPIEVRVMLTWGELVARLERMERVLPAMDSFVAAIALHGNFTLVTRNVRDFEATGVRMVNP